MPDLSSFFPFLGMTVFGFVLGAITTFIWFRILADGPWERRIALRRLKKEAADVKLWTDLQADWENREPEDDWEDDFKDDEPKPRRAA